MIKESLQVFDLFDVHCSVIGFSRTIDVDCRRAVSDHRPCLVVCCVDCRVDYKS